MSDPFENYSLRIMSGQQRGWSIALASAMAAAEPSIAASFGCATRSLTRALACASCPGGHQSGQPHRRGTGKTPVVRWLCEQLRTAGMHPAVLMRGYKSADGLSDEQRMLEQALNQTANALGQPPIIVRANPDRLAGGNDVLREDRRSTSSCSTTASSIAGSPRFRSGAHQRPRAVRLRSRPPARAAARTRAGLRRASAVLITRCMKLEPRRARDN